VLDEVARFLLDDVRQVIPCEIRRVTVRPRVTLARFWMDAVADHLLAVAEELQSLLRFASAVVARAVQFHRDLSKRRVCSERDGALRRLADANQKFACVGDVSVR
jgi:hypothetical protein